MFGRGEQTRSFCYVTDLIDALVRLMRSRDDFVGPVNLGNPNEFTILELAELTIRLTGSKSQIVFLPLPQDDPTQRRPDIRLAESELGWRPQVPLAQGLERTIGYFDALLKVRGIPRAAAAPAHAQMH